MERLEELSIEERRRLAEIVAEAERRERDRPHEYPTDFPGCDEPWHKSH